VKQVKTRKCTMGAIVTHRDFLQGMQDYLYGLDYPPKVEMSWQYERGRLYAAAKHGQGKQPILQQRVGREFNWSLVRDVALLMDHGDIL
jgi:hypothetical protein